MNMDVTDPSQFKYTQYTTYSALSDPTPNQREFYYNLNLMGGLGYSNKFGQHTVEARAFARAYRNQSNGYVSSNRYLSYNGQVTYDYANRYIFSGNISSEKTNVGVLSTVHPQVG